MRHRRPSAASKGNDQVRMETAIATQNPRLKVPPRCATGTSRTPRTSSSSPASAAFPVEEPIVERVKVDRNLWGVSLYVSDLADAWQEPPPEAYVLTRRRNWRPASRPRWSSASKRGATSLDGKALDLLLLVRELNRVGGGAWHRALDVVEDRLFGIKSREFYEAPTPTILWAAHRDLQNLVQSRETIQLRELWAGVTRNWCTWALVPRSAPRPARVLRRDAEARHRRGSAEAVQGELFGRGPTQPAQPVRQPAGESVESGAVREPVGSRVHVAVGIAGRLAARLQPTETSGN